MNLSVFMIWLCAVLCATLATYVTDITVPADKPLSPFSASTGVILTEDDVIAFPSDMWVIRLRINLTPYVSAISLLINHMILQLTIRIGPDSCREDQEVEYKCPPGTATILVPKVEKERAAAEKLAELLMNRNSEITARWRHATVDKRTDFPHMSMDLLQNRYPWTPTQASSDKLPSFILNGARKTCFPVANGWYTASNWDSVSLGLDNGSLVFDTRTVTTGDKNHLEVIHDMTEALNTIAALLDRMEPIFESLNDNRIPLMMLKLPDGSIRDCMTSINSLAGSALSVEADAFRVIMSTTTYSHISAECLETTNCREMDIFTLVPMWKPTEVYTLRSVVTMPVARNTYLKDPKWEMVHIETKYVLQGVANSYALEDLTAFNCIPPNSALSNRICYFLRTPTEDVGPCLAAIMGPENNKSIDVCELEEISTVPEGTVALDDHTWAFSDVTPGTLTTVCGDKTTAYDMPYSGILSLLTTCSYTMVNGPFEDVTPHIPGITFAAVTGKQLVKDIRQIGDDLTDIQTHFKDFGYVYVISSVSVSSVLIIAITIFCCRRFSRRQQKRTQKKRSKKALKYVAAPSVRKTSRFGWRRKKRDDDITYLPEANELLPTAPRRTRPLYPKIQTDLMPRRIEFV